MYIYIFFQIFSLSIDSISVSPRGLDYLHKIVWYLPELSFYVGKEKDD